MNLPPGWYAVSDAAPLDKELRRELPRGHKLSGLGFTAIAHADEHPDTVLFSLSDGRFAVVHLTWKREKDSRWPWTRIEVPLPAVAEADEG